jgi:hypothetical protein
MEISRLFLESKFGTVEATQSPARHVNHLSPHSIRYRNCALKTGAFHVRAHPRPAPSNHPRAIRRDTLWHDGGCKSSATGMCMRCKQQAWMWERGVTLRLLCSKNTNIHYASVVRRGSNIQLSLMVKVRESSTSRTARRERVT